MTPHDSVPGQAPGSARELAALCDQIVATHHAFLRRELPRVDELVARLAEHHGASHAALRELADRFRGFRAELEAHMEKEERVLFPAIRARAAGHDPDTLPCPGFEGPLRVMTIEHDQASGALAAFRRLTNDYRPPPEGCATWREAYEGLAALDADLERHIALENDVLFPAVRALG